MQFGRVAACNSLYELYPPLVEVHGCDGLLDECSGVLRWKLSSPIAGGTRSLLARAGHFRQPPSKCFLRPSELRVRCGSVRPKGNRKRSYILLMPSYRLRTRAQFGDTIIDCRLY